MSGALRLPGIRRGCRLSFPSGQFRIIICQQDEDAISHLEVGRQQKVFQKCFFIVAGTGHFGRDELVAKGNTAVDDAEIVFSIHIITSRIAGEMRFFYIELDGSSFAGGRVGCQYRLQIPGTIQYGGIEDNGMFGHGCGHSGGTFCDGVPGDGSVLRLWLLTCEQGQAGKYREYVLHTDVFFIRGSKTMPIAGWVGERSDREAGLGNKYPAHTGKPSYAAISGGQRPALNAIKRVG